MSFHVGQKVVCVDSKDTISLLEKGEVYVVLSIKGCECEQNIDIGLRDYAFCGTMCYNCFYDLSTGSQTFFRSSRFAPIQEKREHNKCKISISINNPVEETTDLPIEVGV